MRPKRLHGASVRDPSLNLPQGGGVDNRLRINQFHSQAVMRGIGEEWWAKIFSQSQAKEVRNKKHFFDPVATVIPPKPSLKHVAESSLSLVGCSQPPPVLH
jgi:hypothetical protein